MWALGNPVYRFAGFTLKPAERRLSAAGKAIALTPKVFDTLLLIERAGHVVSKDELMKELWRRGYVDEPNLTKHIWLIRRALREGAEAAFKIIEAALSQAGASLKDVVRRGVFITKREDIPAVVSVLRRKFAAIRPANTTVTYELPNSDALVEIEVTARLGTDRRPDAN
jgi:hypothetical protein